MPTAPTIHTFSHPFKIPGSREVFSHNVSFATFYGEIDNDDVGYRLMKFLGCQSLRVLEEVSLCGFDNLDPRDGLPKMTSINWPFEDIGAAAVRRVLRRGLDITTAPLHLMLRGRLVLGASTAPFPGGI
jgi:DNA-binding LacI/PurR family transcriptional regulator